MGDSQKCAHIQVTYDLAVAYDYRRSAMGNATYSGKREGKRFETAILKRSNLDDSDLPLSGDEGNNQNRGNTNVSILFYRRVRIRIVSELYILSVEP